LLLILWYALFRPQIRSTAQDQVNRQLSANGITPVSTGATGSKGSATGGSSGGGGGSSAASGGGAGAGSTATTFKSGGGLTVLANGALNRVAQASGNGMKVLFNVPAGRSLEITDLLVENTAGDVGNLALADDGSPVMQWAMANFRDLDYHWITPTVFGSGSQVQMIVTGCTGPCTPAIYFAGHLVSG
jgi:hypothetical protein